MAEEVVSKDQFEEFTKRMEQGFEHVNKRFDDMKSDMAGIRADIRQMRNWLIGLYGIVVFGFIGSIFLSIIKTSVP
jgi:hypothetical protein